VRAARATIALAALALLVPAGASAHATLTAATPGIQATIDEAPRVVTLRFSQGISLVADSLQVYAADGSLVSAAPTLSSDRRTVTARVAARARGAYTVRWRELSADGHIGSGVFTYGVGVPAPSPTEAVGASGLTWRDDVARWGAFAALAVLLGPLVLRLVVLRGADLGGRAANVFSAATVLGAFLVIDVGILAFVLRAENALRLSIVDLLYGDLTPFAEETRFGIAFLVMMVGFGAVAALAILAWSLDRPALLWPALVLTLLFASGFSLSGHQATEPNSSWATQIADWVHLVAASTWAGGVLALAALVWPFAPALRRQAFLGFSRIAVVLVGVLVLAGTYLSVVRLPEVSDLWTTSYGHVLLVKLAIVSVALAWGGFHHTFVRPRLQRGEAVGRGVGRSLIGESMVAMAVLLAAAVLVNGSPPPPVSAAPTEASSGAP
jgi:copper transport protein